MEESKPTKIFEITEEDEKDYERSKKIENEFLRWCANVVGATFFGVFLGSLLGVRLNGFYHEVLKIHSAGRRLTTEYFATKTKVPIAEAKKVAGDITSRQTSLHAMRWGTKMGTLAALFCGITQTLNFVREKESILHPAASGFLTGMTFGTVSYGLKGVTIGSVGGVIFGTVAGELMHLSNQIQFMRTKSVTEDEDDTNDAIELLQTHLRKLDSEETDESIHGTKI